jgi:uncharacterized protein (TIGR02453 family)
MAGEARFEGFPRQAPGFLKQLAKNNNRKWFDAHRGRYEAWILEPSRAFVVAMGEKLTRIAPDIEADPRVNGSLFRISRDTRFARDKSPYKTNVGIYFWEGSGKRMECPGFYFHLEPDSLMVGAGIYRFPRGKLEAYRKAAVDKELGHELRAAVNKVGKTSFGRTGCRMPAPHYKRVPAGYDPDHFNAELLKYRGLYAGYEDRVPAELHGARLVDYCFERFRKLEPIHRWLVKAL